VLCRVADDMFWMSRYVERAIAVARLIDNTWHLELDVGDPARDEAGLWAPLVGSAGEAGFLPPDGALAADPREVRYRLAFDGDNPNSLLSCIRSARAAARGVREAISSEMWEQLNRLYLSLTEPQLAARAEDSPHAFYSRVREGAQLFQGLADCTLAHDEPWHFLTLGKYLERADNVARVLKLQTHLLAGGESARADAMVRWLAVLRSCGSAEAFAHYYSLRVEPARVVEFLLLNPVFPQSVRFSLRCALAALEQVATGQADSGGSPVPGVRSLGLLSAQLQYAAVDEILERGLGPFLTDVQQRIGLASDQLALTFFRSHTRPDRHMPVARAAELMAAQQQQTRLGRC
jgi:uncharacterized alpha-E superfamily protein